MPVTVDNELVLWSGTSGEEVKQATGTGIVSVTSGVFAASTAPTFSDFTNAQHDHLDANDGGTLTKAAISDFPTGANGLQLVEARTATADGTGTAVVTAGVDWVDVTSASANNIIVLPNAARDVIALEVGANGYELRSHDPANAGINGGTGSGAESAIPANTKTICIANAAMTNWTCTNTATNGDVTKTEVAAP